MKLETIIRKRNINIDVLRCIAVCSVLGVHYFLQTSFYQQPMIGVTMGIKTIIRTFFMICVPLFLLLTGYLMNRKELSKRYYKGIVQVLGIYLLASIACLLFNVFVEKESYTFIEYIRGFTTFQFANYAWYVNMYIGLFLLIPFLNMIWNNRMDQKYHLFLVITFLSLTALPSILPSSFMPDWWMGGLYPITYYFIGAYIKDHDIRLHIVANLGLLILCVIGFGAFNFYYSHGDVFRASASVDWQGYQNVIDTVLVFLLILHLPLQNLSIFIKYMIYKVSECSFGLYLVSSIFDHFFYPRITTNTWIIPILVFVCSLILSQILLWIYKGIVSLFTYNYMRIQHTTLKDR